MSTDDPAIDVVGLTRAFAGQTVVQGVTMQVAPGDIIGLVGANGGGKTTTLRMISGLLRPTTGSGQVLGRNVMQPARAHRSAIGYMAQSIALYPDLTVAENLMFRARLHCCADPHAAIAMVVADCKLSTVLPMRVAHLSGGWARRVQFAATIIHRPCLLLLDEPTAGLDVVTRHDIWEWVVRLSARGCAVLVSTHDLAEAERCPAIIHYHNGIAEGPFSPAAFVREAGADSLEAAVIKGARA
ncbi:MAG: ABC transporter ATP-binding protein [Sphingomonadaceae bacterium]